jgi:RNA polymerase sigma-70 factor (ECF subfamily)
VLITSQAATTALDHAASNFASLRPRLFGIAYRMLGSSADAEDIVQDAWLRWQTCDRDAVVNSTAFLVTTTTRLAINAAQSARWRRETCVGPWLPEPVDASADPELRAERDEALALAVLLLLERLSPTEQAAYVLREAFDYPYSRIARVLHVNEANARQLVSRARKHVRVGRCRSVSFAEQERLLNAFLAAAQKGDFIAIEEIFAAALAPVAA